MPSFLCKKNKNKLCAFRPKSNKSRKKNKSKQKKIIHSVKILLKLKQKNKPIGEKKSKQILVVFGTYRIKEVIEIHSAAKFQKN